MYWIKDTCTKCLVFCYRVRNCTFLVANATKNFALATRISQLVASGRLTTLFHTTIITQTIALIFIQIDQNKIQSLLSIGHFLFTFPLLSISFYQPSQNVSEEEVILKLETVCLPKATL